jgi:hypothetical protein
LVRITWSPPARITSRNDGSSATKLRKNASIGIG